LLEGLKRAAMNSTIDRGLFFLYRRVATFVFDTQRKHRSLITCDATIDDNSIVTLSLTTIRSLQLSSGDIVLLEGRKCKDTIAVVLVDDTLDYGYVGMNSVIRRNLLVQLGHVTFVRPCPDIKFVNRMIISPVACTVNGLTGSLFGVFLMPYFCETYRPLKQGDFFTCNAVPGMVEFEVVEMDPPNHGVVTQDTVIYCVSNGYVTDRSMSVGSRWSLAERSINRWRSLNFTGKLRMVGKKFREHIFEGSLGRERSCFSSMEALIP
jgi:hypothetical protein